MPASLYLSCKFISPHSFRYQWREATASEWQAAQEICGVLFRHMRRRTEQTLRIRSFQDRLESLEKKGPPKISYRWGVLKTKLSVELLQELDNESAAVNYLLLAAAISYFEGFQGLDLSINFREVFLVPEGASPPSHYRPGIDLCVKTEAEFLKQTRTFSYLLAKSIFHRFMSDSPLIAPYLTENYQLNSILHFDITRPLYEYPIFSSPLLAAVALSEPNEKCLLHIQYNRGKPLIVAFGPEVTIRELEYYLLNIAANCLQEIIVLFYGSQYASPEEREKVYQEMLRITYLRDRKSLLHIFLLTQETVPYRFQDLAPQSQNSSETFSSLAHNAGFYLSTSKIFANIFLNKQSEPQKLDWLQTMNLNNSPAESKGISPYIYGEKETPNFRKSKRMTKAVLKAKAAVSMNQQLGLQQNETITEAKAITETEVLNQTQMLQETVSYNKNKNLDSGFSFPTCLDFDGFCRLLKEFATEELKTLDWQSKAVLEQVHQTQYYLNHPRNHCTFIEKLALNEAFRKKIAATAFGVALIETDGQSSLVSLPNYSIDSVEIVLAYWLKQLALWILDGPDPKHDTIESKFACFGGRVWTMGRAALNPGLYDNSHYHFISSLNDTFEAYQSHLQYFVLLRENDLKELPLAEQAVLIQQAEELLYLHHPVMSSDLALRSCNITHLETAFFAITAFHFGKNPEDLQCLERFFAVFEDHNRDNLRILTQILMLGYRHKMDTFLKFLTILDSRSLLPTFYKIYLKYAKDVFSVVRLLSELESVNPEIKHFKQLLGNPFPYLVLGSVNLNTIPNYRLFENFCYRLFIFQTKHYPGIPFFDISRLHDFWCNLSTAFLAYTNGQEQEAQALLESFMATLLVGEDLSLQPGEPGSVLQNILRLLENAIKAQTLEEQLKEINGLSLLRTDALYAINHNDFQLLCSEMDLYKEAIHPTKKSYAVSLQELQQALLAYEPGKEGLKRSVFRYLGKTHFRESLQFYRRLFAQCENSLDQLIVGYYVASTTGERNPKPTKDDFCQEFLAFLKTHPWGSTLEKGKVAEQLSQFFDTLQHQENDASAGVSCLWSFWRAEGIAVPWSPSREIPAILCKKFILKELKIFLFCNKKALEAVSPELPDEEELSLSLIRSWTLTQEKASFEHTAIILLKILYKPLTLSLFLQNVTKIITFVEAYTLLVQRGGRGKLYAALKKIAEQSQDIDQVTGLIRLISPEMAESTQEKECEEACTQFLEGLASQGLLAKAADNKPFYALFLKYYLATKFPNVSLSTLFHLSETLEGNLPLASCLLSKMHQRPVYTFLHNNQYLNKEQLEIISQLLQPLQDTSLILPLLQLALAENQKTDFRKLRECLKTLNPELMRYQVSLASLLCQDSLAELKRLKNVPESILEALMHTHELYPLRKNELISLLDSPSVLTAIETFERAKQAENLERFRYDPMQVTQKIAGIRYKAQNGELLPLSPQTQKALYQDYETLMSYMQNKPVLLWQGKTFTIHELSQSQCQLLLTELIERIRNDKKSHAYQLMLLALASEVLYRTTKKFPRNTQLITVLHSLYEKRSLIHEVQTGEGKSIIAALRAVLLYDAKTNIDIVTENDHLAKEGLNTFKYMFRYLGIPCAKVIIEPDSPHKHYVERGVNYSTPSHLALFRARMLLLKKTLPTKVALICDEIDAFLKTLVQFRLSATIDPLLLDSKWPAIYKALLEFVENKKLFTENLCDEEADVSNFRGFFSLQNPGKELVDFVNTLPQDLLHTLIESVQIANALDVNQDYFIVEKKGVKPTYYAAPILDSNSRPDPRVSYSAAVQQIIHTSLNQKGKKLKYPCAIDPISETIIIVSAKNFFDFYRHLGGLIIGLTGTGGFEVELQEFWENHGLVAFSYPPFHENPPKDLGLIAVRGPEQLGPQVEKILIERNLVAPGQPVLIFTDSPQDTIRLQKSLSKTTFNPQIYHGIEAEGQSESELIQQAGQDTVLTIANESLARGADFKPKHPQGLFLIIAKSEGTESDFRQMIGRTRRNGNDGQYCIVVDRNVFAPQEVADEEIPSLFKAHQRKLSLLEHRQRIQLYALEKTRYCMVNTYLLSLRLEADRILNRQYGYGSDLVNLQELMSTLAQWNTKAEAHYQELLQKHGSVEGEHLDAFLNARIAEYQEILNRWLPKERFQHFNPIEPRIPVENLQGLEDLHAMRIKDLSAFSVLFAKIWQYFGHQKMQQGFAKIDQQVDLLTPYFNKQCSLQFAVAASLDGQGLIDPSLVGEAFKAVKIASQELLDLAGNIPLIGPRLPKESVLQFWLNYLEKTEKQIQEKRWDDLDLPTIDLNKVYAWFRCLSAVAELVSILNLGAKVAAGPIPLIVNTFVLPTVMSWLSKKFANSDIRCLQAIAGLSNIAGDLSTALSCLLDSSRRDSMTVGMFLKELGPLLKNPALQEAIIALLNMYGQTNYIPYVRALPKLLNHLLPYQDYKLSELLTVEFLVFCLTKAYQLDSVKEFLGDADFEVLLEQCQFSPEVLVLFRNFDFKAFFGLIKVLAHPEFLAFLQSLPRDASFSEMLNWQKEPATCPLSAQEGLLRLNTYQSEPARIAEESRSALLTLNEKFSLSLPKLKQELQEKLPAQPILLPEVPVVSPPIPWLRYGMLTAGFISLVLYNIFFFSLSILITSLILLAIAAYPFIKNKMSALKISSTMAEPGPIVLAPEGYYKRNGFFKAETLPALAHSPDFASQKVFA